MSWLTAPISDFAILNSGYAFKSANWTDSGIPVVKITNVKSGGVNLSGCGWVAEETVKGLDRYRLNIGDLLITMTGDVGDIGLVRDDAAGAYLNQRVGRFKIIDPRLGKDFLRFCLQLPDLRDTFRAVAYGAAQPNISPTLILAQEITLPPLATQRKIASILSAYDDLIENNTRRVRVLEDMARALYREWFVEYRFPGHEQAEFVEDEQGRRPAGWANVPLAHFGNFITGKTPSKTMQEYFGGDIPFIKIPDMKGIFTLSTSESLSALGSAAQKKKLVPTESILVSCIGTVGKVTITTQPSQFNQQINAITPEKRQLGFLYFLIESLKTDLEMIGLVGATMPNVSKGKLENMRVVDPGRLADDFSDHVQPLLDSILNLTRRNANLRRTRDLLLPRLVSGELDVSELEIAGVDEEAVA